MKERLWVCLVLCLWGVTAAYVSKPAWSHIKRKCLFLGLFLGAVAAGVGLYGKLGSYQQVSRQWFLEEHQSDILKWRDEIKTPERAILLLRQHLAKNPKQTEGWLLLGRLYMDLSEHENALHAFEEGLFLHPKDPEFLLHAATANYWRNQQHLDPLATLRLQQVLAQRPDDPQALELLAGDAYHHQKIPQAVHYLQRILSNLDPNSEGAKQLLAEINRIQKSSDSKAAPKQEWQLTITVDSSRVLQKKPPQNAVLLVYAKVKGSKIPIAAKRVAIDRWPMKVSLSSQDNPMQEYASDVVEVVKKEGAVDLYAKIVSSDSKVLGLKGERVRLDGGKAVVRLELVESRFLTKYGWRHTPDLSLVVASD